MTLAPGPRRVLPMQGHTKGSRSATVCHFKCADACASPAPNTTETSYFPDVVATVLRRRTVVAGGLSAMAGAAVLSVAGAAPAAAERRHDKRVAGYEFDRNRTVQFDPIDPVPNTVDDVVVPEGWTWTPIIAWGDPIVKGAPAFDVYAQSPEAQAVQFGYNNDYLTIIDTGEKRRSAKQALLVANHEYVNPELMFPDWDSTDPAVIRRNVEIAMYAHGLTVVAVERRGRSGPWRVNPLLDDPRNRRIHHRTAFAVDGPAAGSSYLRTAADPTGQEIFGTLNNCAGGTTPWGTVLSGEENWNQYFKATPEQAATLEFRRYGIGTRGRGFELVEPRFAGSVEPNEPNRFGYIVELDPFEPDEAPVKHTALGRFKHEGATIRIATSGHVVAYMGDDERFDYVYKFVSADKYDPSRGARARRHNKQLLSTGDLFVARFTGDGLEDGISDGTGEWIPLVEKGESKVPGFTVEQVLVFTRLAADAVQATKMDRPEDVQPSPVTGKVYIACTNNTRRGVDANPGPDEANPRARNKDGHVIELIEDKNDARSRTFTWNLILVCGDPEDETIPVYFGGYTGPVSPISCPDNIAFDGAGNLWISTDGQPGTIGLNDALHRVVAEGPERGKVEQFMALPTGSETCGPIIDSDGHDGGSVFVAVQHPGDTDTDFANPSSRFPYLDDGFDGPRPAVIQIYRGKELPPTHRG